MSARSIAVSEKRQATRITLVSVAWERIGLGAILLLAALLNFIQLDRVGLGNSYYASAVKSMLLSWHNFFFVSFDPGGFVTIDKPPLAFWLQTASAKVFGFNGVSLILPEAIAGVLSVWLLYGLVARVYGRPAGLLAALALAITPVSVLVDRTNLVESILVLTLLLAAWATTRAVEQGRLRWIVLAGVFVGLGFNVKSLEAYLAAPAIFLAYFVGARIRWHERVWHVVLAGIAMLVVSLAWVTAVDLTPASQRPYVASSGNNSELSLAIGYNGLGRLTGNTFSFLSGGATVSSTLSNLSPTNLGFTQGETGSPGIQRLVNASLGGQTGWLILLAIIGFIVVMWQRRPHWPLDREQSMAVLWGAWLATGVAFFSIAGFFHAYYLATLAPPIAALSGIALVTLWRAYRSAGWRGWALPVALIATALVQAHILGFFPAWNGWQTPLVVGCAAVLALILAALRIDAVRRRFAQQTTYAMMLGAAVLGTLALLLSPFIWSEYTVANAAPSMAPSAGPSGGGGFGGFGGGGTRHFRTGSFTLPNGKHVNFQDFAGRGFRGRFGHAGGGGFGDGTAANPALVKYLETHQGNAKFLVATANASAAEPYILSTGKPVMDLGGFNGGDRILTVQQLAALVDKGTVRYFLVSGRGFGGGGFGSFGSAGASGTATGGAASARSFGAPSQPSATVALHGGARGAAGNANSDLTQWVTTNCKAVASSAYGVAATSPTAGGNFGFGGATQPLYDCSAYAAAHTSS